MGPENEEYGEYFAQPLDFNLNEFTAKLDYSHVLFVDFDGVLHPEFASRDTQMCFSKNFCAAVRAVDETEQMPIVISSSWRIQTPLHRMRSFFDEDIAKRVVGSTPDFLPETKITEEWRPFVGPSMPARQREIEAWMSKNSPNGKWLAIDDMPKMFSKDCPNLFVVPSKPIGGGYGLTDDLMPKFIEALRTFKEAPAPQPTKRRTAP